MLTRWLAKSVGNYDSKEALGSKLRARRIVPLMRMMDEVYRERGAINILDVGGTARYWNIIPPEKLDALNVNFTVINIPGWPKPPDFGRFRFLEADGRDMHQYANGEFDIAHSNSVIEHVGGWEDMARFAAEVRRVAKRLFIQTPNFWFPVEPHAMAPLFHWLPRPLRILTVRSIQLGQWDRAKTWKAACDQVDSARLLRVSHMKQLFPDCEIHREIWFGLPKSLIAIRG